MGYYANAGALAVRDRTASGWTASAILTGWTMTASS
jgi:hypothetical protein